MTIRPYEQALFDRITELRAALEPFAREADRIDPNGPDESIGDGVEIWQSGPTEITRSRITYGDLRRARNVLT